ncbi:hypothetical protein [Legionella tunisiensis]
MQETPLLLAARLGRLDHLKAILESKPPKNWIWKQRTRSPGEQSICYVPA